MWAKRGAIADRSYRRPASEDLRRYSRVAVVLHWAIAGFILFNLATGLFMEGFAQMLRKVVIPLHISSGMTVLPLTLVRIVWRLTHRPPPPRRDEEPWERVVANLVHGLLYLLMLIMPLTGWSLISAHPAHQGHGPTLWGILSIPPITPIARLAAPLQRSAHGAFVQTHTIAGWILLGLLILHIAGGLKHQLVDGRGSLERMRLG